MRRHEVDFEVGEVRVRQVHLDLDRRDHGGTRDADRGVGIAVVTHDKDMHGKTTTVFHKFYYEPTYEKGGNGYETCIKQGL